MELGDYISNRHGEYICESCRKRGVRWPIRRQIPRMAAKFWKKGRPLIIYLAVGFIALCVAYAIIDHVAGAPPPEAEALP